MDYEKAYKEALERAREIKSKILSSHLSTESCKAVSEYIDTIIPELAESEDERNIDTIFNCLYQCCDTGFISGTQRDNALAYLEKQKETLHIGKTCKEKADSFTREQKVQKQYDDDLLNDPRFLDGFDVGREVQKIFDVPKPAEWSEEDERKRQACISTINEVIDYERERWEDYNPGKPYRPIMKYDEQIDWLKSLRPSWKPSEEQMGALNYFIKLWGNSDDQLEYTKIFNTVKSLRDDLEKLM